MSDPFVSSSLSSSSTVKGLLASWLAFLFLVTRECLCFFPLSTELRDEEESSAEGETAAVAVW